MPLPVCIEDLQKMHLMVAALVSEDPVYLPIFLRIEQELLLLDTRTSAIERARIVAERHKAAA